MNTANHLSSCQFDRPPADTIRDIVPSENSQTTIHFIPDSGTKFQSTSVVVFSRLHLGQENLHTYEHAHLVPRHPPTVCASIIVHVYVIPKGHIVPQIWAAGQAKCKGTNELSRRTCNWIAWLVSKPKFHKYSTTFLAKVVRIKNSWAHRSVSVLLFAQSNGCVNDPFLGGGQVVVRCSNGTESRPAADVSVRADDGSM